MSDSPERRHFTRIAFDGKVQLIDPADHRQWQTEVLELNLGDPALLERELAELLDSH